jgi:hypothetical protein
MTKKSVICKENNLKMNFSSVYYLSFDVGLQGGMEKGSSEGPHVRKEIPIRVILSSKEMEIYTAIIRGDCANKRSEREKDTVSLMHKHK